MEAKKNVLLVIVLLLSLSITAFADRQLEREETLQVLQQITSQPRKAWISAGTIEATHEEYKAPKITDPNRIKNQISQTIAEHQSDPAQQSLTENPRKMKLDAIPFNVRYKLSNEYAMLSAVTVRFDGDRFYWEINVDSRTDSVKPDKDLAGNYMTEQFNLDFNARRIFAWDGEKYTMYSPNPNGAYVDTKGQIGRAVNGPLTAGFVPWGHGFYTYDNLATIDLTVVEKIVDGQLQIHLTLHNVNGSERLYVMDPEKDYAMLSCSIETDDVIISRQYSDYQLVSGLWVPATILLERFDALTNRLLARDLWIITTIDGSIPPVDSFDVEYEDDALIKYASAVTDRPAMYRHSQIVDTDALLAERLEYAANQGLQPQNCATAALKYTAGRLGKDVADAQLAELVTEPNEDTTLFAVKQFAEGLGLYCRAVITDINTLQVLEDCQVILHIPGKKHFVVLESIDSSFVRIVDLASDKFYYRISTDFFDMDWTAGVALLISNGPIGGDFAEIGDSELNNFVGASGGYACDSIIQEEGYIGCVDIGGCDGNCYVWFTMLGCISVESGYCNLTWMVRGAKSPCEEKIEDPLACTVTEEWTYYWIRACGTF